MPGSLTEVTAGGAGGGWQALKQERHLSSPCTTLHVSRRAQERGKSSREVWHGPVPPAWKMEEDTSWALKDFLKAGTFL